MRRARGVLVGVLDRLEQVVTGDMRENDPPALLLKGGHRLAG